MTFWQKYYIIICSEFLTKEGFAISKIDKAVIKETSFVGIWVLIFSAVLQCVFLLVGKWNYTVLLGNLLSGAVSVLNFFLLGITVQKAIETGDVKAAKARMRISQFARLVMLGIVAVLGATLSCFDLWATLIPMLFPRASMIIRQILLKKEKGGQDDSE